MLLQRTRLENEQRKRPKEVAAEEPLTATERAISPLEVMLAQVRNTTPDGRLPSDAQVLENVVGKDRAKELIGEKVIVVDSTGAAIAPPPAAEPAAPEGSTSAEDFSSLAAAAPPTPKAHVFLDADLTKPKAAPPPPPQTKQHPAAHMPGFGEFLSSKATADADAERAKKVEAARAQGRPQISREEAFPPDPREGPEVVRFTLAPGGRIRRVAG